METKRVNEAVRNNPDRFPEGYIIELNEEEKQKVVENFDHLGNIRFSPHNSKAFTEKGLYMIATNFAVLNFKHKITRKSGGAE